jgi:hypothetical protein
LTKPADNALFLADASDMSISTQQMRKNWKSGKYGAVRRDYAQDWMEMAGRLK